MKEIKHNLVIAFLFGITGILAQTKTQKYSESFKVNNDVILEINAHHSDITVEYWDKNEILVESLLSIDGVSDDEAKEYFEYWNIEALGNSKRVVVNSQPNFDFHFEGMNFTLNDMHIEIPEMDFQIPPIEIEIPEMDFEPLIAFAFDFDSLSYPTPPEMPEIVIAHMSKIKWDPEAFEREGDAYVERFEKEQEKLEQEFEEKYGEQMRAYEEEMEKWEEEFAEQYEPKMEEYEKEMEKWQKEFEEKYEPKMKEYEKEMEKWAAKYEKEIEPKMKEMEKEIEKQMKGVEEELEKYEEKMKSIKKEITIKIPRGAKVDLDTHKGTIKLPNNIEKV